MLTIITIVICVRLQDSRLGRAWMAIREDEIAAKAMGINVRNVKLLAFSLGATFGGVSGAMFSAFQGFVSPESFTLNESIIVLAMVVLGGLGHIPGVVLGAILLAMFPEVLRHTVVPAQNVPVRPRRRRRRSPAHDALRPGDGADHAVPAEGTVAGARAWRQSRQPAPHTQRA